MLVDLRESLRSVRRDRGFSVTVILTLAITIGATTAAFSIVNGILLKPLAYPEPGQLVTLREIWREMSLQASTLEVNQRHFEYWRRHTRLFDSMAQFIALPANLTSGGPATQISAIQASGSVFAVLREPAALGRVLTSDDDRPGSADVVVIGDALWRQRFGGSPGVIGTSMVIDGTPYTIVGVLRPAFRLPEGQRLAANIDAVVPMRITVGWVGDHNNAAIGRLKSGVTIEEAQAEIEVLQRQVGEIATAESQQRVTLSAVVTSLTESLVGRARRGVIVLFAAIIAVLAIACSNLTNLALIRAMARSRDVAIRSALGAGRVRLIARAVLDFALLAAAGGALGLWVAYAAIRLFVSTAPIDLPRVEDVTLDARVLLFAAMVTGLTGLLVAILPIVHTGDRDPQSALRSGSAASGHGPSSVRTRAILTSLQVALTVTLLTITGLLGASLWRVLGVDYGFTTDRVLSVSLALPAARYESDRVRIDAFDRIIAALHALPGVRSVSSTSLLPMRGEGQVNFVVAAGTTVPRSEQPTANFRFIAPDYFSTLEMPVQRGRMFTLADRDGNRMTAVVSASLAERLWPGQDALGKEFSRGIDGEPGFEVIGIAPDARTTSLERTPPLMVYVPYWWRTRTTLSLLVKTERDPLALAPSIRRALDQIDPEIAVGQTRLLQQAVDAATAGRRYQARLFVVFGAVALLIATLGVYGVTAYSVSKRRREMNIRVALGANQRDVTRLFVRQSAFAVVPGVVAGLVGALATGNAVASLLYDVQPRDPLVLGGAATAVTLVALAASLLATRGGLSLDPAAALREE
jgi:putative ABC transport system permease protein